MVKFRKQEANPSFGDFIQNEVKSLGLSINKVFGGCRIRHNVLYELKKTTVRSMMPTRCTTTSTSCRPCSPTTTPSRSATPCVSDG